MACSRNWQRLIKGDRCPRGSPSFNKGRLVHVSLTIHINQIHPLVCTFGCMVTVIKPQSEHGLRHLACSDDDGVRFEECRGGQRSSLAKHGPDGWNTWRKQNLGRFLGCWLHQLPHTYVKEGRVCQFCLSIYSLFPMAWNRCALQALI
jgi:hypothetical protein